MSGPFKAPISPEPLLSLSSIYPINSLTLSISLNTFEDILINSLVRPLCQNYSSQNKIKENTLHLIQTRQSYYIVTNAICVTYCCMNCFAINEGICFKSFENKLQIKVAFIIVALAKSWWQLGGWL